MAMPALQDFYLVRGTALSLMYGHRTSIDLDLFSTTRFDNHAIIEDLKAAFGSDFVMEDKPAFFGIFCYINDIKN